MREVGGVAAPRARVAVILCSLFVMFALTGCLEQLQTTRIPSGALSNFVLHLELGELDDARTYFAPGLVTPSPELDNSLVEASHRLQAYEIKNGKFNTEQLGNGQIRETMSGQVRKRVPKGQPTPVPDEGWQQTDIISARMV